MCESEVDIVHEPGSLRMVQAGAEAGTAIARSRIRCATSPQGEVQAVWCGVELTRSKRAEVEEDRGGRASWLLLDERVDGRVVPLTRKKLTCRDCQL